MAVRTKVVGARRLDRQMRQLPQAFLDEVTKVLVRAGRTTERDARRLAPQRTGAGAATIGTDATNPLEVRVGSDDLGLFFQEIGTAHHDPQPWLRPAFRLNRRRLPSRLRSGFRRAAKKVLGS